MSESLWRRTIEGQGKGKVKTWSEHVIEEQIEDTWQAQVDAGVALAEMAGRVRELEERLARAEENAPISLMLANASDDEWGIASAFVAKLMGEGRSEHGALDFASDPRTVPDLLREALDEQLDACFYVMAARRKAGL